MMKHNIFKFNFIKHYYLTNFNNNNLIKYNFSSQNGGNSIDFFNVDRYLSKNINNINNIKSVYDYLKNNNLINSELNNRTICFLEERIFNNDFYFGYVYKDSIIGIDMNDDFVFKNIDYNNMNEFDIMIYNENLLLFEEYGLNNMFIYKNKFLSIVKDLNEKKIYKMIFRWEFYYNGIGINKKNKFYTSPSFFIYKNMDISIILNKFKDYVMLYSNKYNININDQLNIDIFIKEWLTYDELKNFDDILKCIKRISNNDLKIKNNKENKIDTVWYNNKLINNRIKYTLGYNIKGMDYGIKIDLKTNF